jgi:hypothetical protein
MMVAVFFDAMPCSLGEDYSETLVKNYQTTRYHVPDAYVFAVHGLSFRPAPSAAGLSWEYCSRSARLETPQLSKYPNLL